MSAPPFTSSMAAKGFLADCIVAQAERDEVPLSEVERKMLFFSEVNDSIPDWKEVGEDFDLEYNQADYEQKVSTLIRRFRDYASTNDPHTGHRFEAALRSLRTEDHYILVLDGISHSSTNRGSSLTAWLERRSFLQLALIGGVIALALIQLMFWWMDRNQS